MSQNDQQDNARVIRETYEAFGRGDVAAIASNVLPDARWDFNVVQSDVPWHVPVIGPAEVPAFLGAFVQNVTLETFEPHHFVCDGEDVIVHVRLAYTVNATGKRVDQEQLHWWKVRSGKIARLKHFEDTAQVIAACRA